LEAGTSRNICNLETRPYEKSLFVGKTREADPFFAWGRPMTSWKKQVRAKGVPPGYGIQHPRKEGKILRDNVGKLPGAAGTA
jgi:hypothetical protein